MKLNLSADEVLTTTRAVRKRLDLERPVEPEVIRECLEIAVQAPSGSNRQAWHWVVVTDATTRGALAALYRRAWDQYKDQWKAAEVFAADPDRLAQQERVADSATYLAEHLHEVPVYVIPCLRGRLEGTPSARQASRWGGLLPAAWSFMLAARERGLGTSWTSLHLQYEREAADLLGIPYDEVAQGLLIPVAYTKGTDFKPAPRKPLDDIVHLERW
jgi:nitroreductase